MWQRCNLVYALRVTASLAYHRSSLPSHACLDDLQDQRHTNFLRSSRQRLKQASVKFLLRLLVGALS